MILAQAQTILPYTRPRQPAVEHKGCRQVRWRSGWATGGSESSLLPMAPTTSLYTWSASPMAMTTSRSGRRCSMRRSGISRQARWPPRVALVNDYWLIRRPSVWCVRTTLRGRVYPPPTSSLLTPWPGNWPAMMMIGDHRSQLRVIGDHRSLWASSTKANSKSPRANAKRKHKKQDDAGRIVTTTLHVMHFATRFHVYKGV